jgi:cytochrome c biogenesis protein CcmG/thiol:disulfide interchange protein DsbE
LAVLAGSGSGGSGVSDPAAFDLPAIEGDARVRLADFRGKPVVVNFFASWCTACDFELPGFARVSDELRDQVTFVGVAALETGDPVTMPERHGITWWPLARDIGSRGNDLHAALGGRGMPVTAYYDDTGNLLHVETGAIDEATLRERITSLYQIEV